MSYTDDIKDMSLKVAIIKDTKDALNYVFNNNVLKTDIVLYVERITKALFFVISRTKHGTVVQELESAALDTLSDTLSFIFHEKGHEGRGTVLKSIIKVKTLIQALSVRGYITERNASILTSAYDSLLKHVTQVREDQGMEDLSITLQKEPVVPPTPETRGALQRVRSIGGMSSRGGVVRQEIKDSRKGQIIDTLTKSGGMSIKEISKLFPGVSEKTLQRELTTLIYEGRVTREGKRRWSTYKVEG